MITVHEAEIGTKWVVEEIITCRCGKELEIVDGSHTEHDFPTDPDAEFISRSVTNYTVAPHVCSEAEAFGGLSNA